MQQQQCCLEIINEKKIRKRNKYGAIKVLYHDSNNYPVLTIGPQVSMYIVMMVLCLGCGIMTIKYYNYLDFSVVQQSLFIVIWISMMTSYSLVSLCEHGIDPQLYSNNDQQQQLDYEDQNSYSIHQSEYVNYHDIIDNQQQHSYQHQQQQEQEQQQEQYQNNRPFCRVCQIYQNQNVVHCRMCNVCSFGFDHHCPWVGKCVAGNNMKYFKMFILCIVFLMLDCAVNSAYMPGLQQ